MMRNKYTQAEITHEEYNEMLKKDFYDDSIVDSEEREEWIKEYGDKAAEKWADSHPDMDWYDPDYNDHESSNYVIG